MGFLIYIILTIIITIIGCCTVVVLSDEYDTNGISNIVKIIGIFGILIISIIIVISIAFSFIQFCEKVVFLWK